MNRRNFLKHTILTGQTLATASVFNSLVPSKSQASGLSIKIPNGFSSKSFSTQGERLNDGSKVPKKHDGMACFAGHNSSVHLVLVRNHEIDTLFGSSSPFPNQAYDPSCGGGTTTIYLDKDLNVVKHFVSLTGTVRNCGGGVTPWDTWISCEESVAESGKIGKECFFDFMVSKKHGYAFEVNPYNETLVKGEPLLNMGRFKREAVCFSNDGMYCYQTEDEADGCFYRFSLKSYGDLKSPGELAALKVNTITDGNKLKVGETYDIEWVEITQHLNSNKTLRALAQELGATKFNAGEGINNLDNNIFFTASKGGSNGKGQIFRVNHINHRHGTIKHVYQSSSTQPFTNPDQLTLNPFGDLIVCEDSLNSRILGIRPDGHMYLIASNTSSEWTGVCFSPDYKYLFANIQGSGLTLAIWGDWQALRDS